MTKKPTYKELEKRVEELEKKAEMHKQIEETLLEDQSRYRAFFEQGPNGVVILDPETARPVEFNDQACRQLEYSREEFALLRLSDIEAKETAKETQVHIKKVLSEGYDDFETIHRTKQGEIRHVHVTAQVIEVTGVPVYHCIWRDITKAKKTEEALRESKTNLDKAQEIAHMGHWVRDLDQWGAQWSDGMYRIYGLRPGDPEQISFEFSLSLVHPNDRERIRSVFIEATEMKHSFDCEFRTIPIKGLEKIIRLRGEVECDETGEAIRRFGVNQDITEQKLAEDALRKSNSNLLSLLENTSDYILLSDRNGSPVMFNSAYAKIVKEALGIDMKPGLKPHELLPDKEAAAFWDDQHRRVLGGEKFRAEYTHEFDEKDVRHLEISFHPIIEKGKVTGFSEVTRDITERRQVEEALKETHQELEKRVEERTADLASVNKRLTKEIEEHRRTEIALRASEEKFLKLFQASPAYISLAVLDEGRFLAVNHAFEKITGYKQSEVIDRTVYELGLWADPNDREKFVKLIKKNHQLPPQRVTLIKKDGKVIEGLWAIERIEIDGKDCIISVFDDITQLMRTRKELRQSEERFSKLFQANPIPSSVTTLEDGRFLEINDAFIKDTGYQAEDVLGRTVAEVGLWANLDERMAFVKLIKEKGRFRDQKVRFLKKNGEPFILLWSAEKVEIDGRECLINANVDITDIEKAGKALRESEEKHRLLLGAMNEGFHILDANTRTVYANNKMCEILGYDYDEIIGRPAFDFLDNTNREAFEKQFKKRKRGKSSSYELTFIKKDGTSTPTILSGRPTFAPDGQFTGSFAVITDISNLKQTQAALQKAHDELELRVKERTAQLAKTVELLKQEVKERKRAETQITASLNEKEVLLREIHHRVRNNLQIVSSLLELARTRTHNKEAIDLLLESHARIHTMALIHSQLYQTDRFDKIHMQKHIQQLITHLSHLYDIDKRITPVVRTAEIHLSLTQAIPCALVLNEVISNIFKHAYKKGEAGTFEVTMEQTRDKKISVKIKDHGGGVPQEIDVFETGSLGLKLTRSLVIDQLKGEMQVNRNNGTEVLIEFPRLKEGV